MQPRTAGRANKLPLVGICLVGFMARVVVIANTQEVGLFADMQDYYDRAVHLLKTGALWRDAFRVPLYPIFIAGVFKLFGPSLLAARLAQAVASVLTVVLTYALARRVAPHRGALAAALIVAIYPALLLYSVYLMAETVFACLVTLAIVLWVSDRRSTALLAGLALGAATLTRSVGLAVLTGVALAELWSVAAKRQGPSIRTAGRMTLLIAGVLIALAPWVLRNYAIYNRIIPTDTSSGFNALLGNYPEATGRHPGIPAVEAAAQKYWSAARNDAERSDEGLRVAREFVRAEPARAARLAMLKVGYLLGLEGREHAWGYSYHLHGRRQPATVWAWGIAIIVSFPLLMTAASVGLWRPGLTKTRGGLVIATTLLSVIAIHIASFGESRFHLPWVPLLAVLAGRAFPDRDAPKWTWPRRAGFAIWMICLVLVWRSQALELLTVLPRLADSPTPLMLPY